MMCGKKYLQCIAGLLILSAGISCGGDDNARPENNNATTPITKDVVAQIYDLYVSKDYKSYIEEMLSCDGKPEEYRKSMENLMHQHATEHAQTSGEITGFSVDSIQTANSGKAAEAYLSIKYSTGNTETIQLQLVHDGHHWRLR